MSNFNKKRINKDIELVYKTNDNNKAILFIPGIYYSEATFSKEKKENIADLLLDNYDFYSFNLHGIYKKLKKDKKYISQDKLNKINQIVFNFLQKRYDNISTLGWSYGGMSQLYLAENNKSISNSVFIVPHLHVSVEWQNKYNMKRLKGYNIKEQYIKKYQKEYDFHLERVKLFENYKNQFSIIFAEFDHDHVRKFSKPLIDSAKSQNIYEIKNANHAMELYKIGSLTPKEIRDKNKQIWNDFEHSLKKCFDNKI